MIGRGPFCLHCGSVYRTGFWFRDVEAYTALWSPVYDSGGGGFQSFVLPALNPSSVWVLVLILTRGVWLGVALVFSLTVRSDWMKSRQSMNLFDGYVVVMKAEVMIWGSISVGMVWWSEGDLSLVGGSSPWEEPPALEVCEVVLVSGAAPISFRRNLGTVKVKGFGDVCYLSLLRD